ncbi:MAG TPA: endopeptidase La [bacterium]|nr:endopeptidase La [bacterium]
MIAKLLKMFAPVPVLKETTDVNRYKDKFPEFFPEQTAEKTPPKKRMYPLLPLRNLVLFPEVIAPVIVGRQDSLRAVDQSLDTNKKIVVLTQKDTQKNLVDPETDLYHIGTLAEIAQHVRLPGSSIRLILLGLRRVRVEGFVEENGIMQAEFSYMPDEADADPIELEAAKRFVISQLGDYIKLIQHVPEDLLNVVDNLDDVMQYLNILANYLPATIEEKQNLLAETNVVKQLNAVGGLLEKECEISNVSIRIREKANQKLKQAEKEYYLREQLKAIQEELKVEDEEDEEYRDLYKQITEKQLPEEAAKQVKDEIKRLKKIPSLSPEYGLIKSYLDLIFDLPWYEKTEDAIELKQVAAVLDEDHYGLQEVKERILEFLAVKKIAPDSKGPILCFVGPPGTGKTSLAKSVARALNRHFIRISLGGVRDEAEIRGHRRTYIGALPGRIINGMKKAEVINPLILLDEVDKMDSDLRGDPTAALLEVLDPEQNNAFVDHFMEIPYDLSQVLFITTANMLYNIPEPLVDRLEIIQLSSYTQEEKIAIMQRHLIPRQIAEHGLEHRNKPVFSTAMIKKIISEYTKEAGVREAERLVAKICRKIAKQLVDKPANQQDTHAITAKDLNAFLGPAKYQKEERETKPQIGIATGLAWTEVGGTILPIEVATMPGKGNLTITGQLGEVMQESAKAALSYIRAREKQFNLPKNFHDKLDLHIHVPEGAVPKDGPSAGIAITSALVSALTRQALSPEFAMTGEITLRGNVLPIGGLKEKLLAAHRAGIPNVIIPRKNEAELTKLPDKIRKQLHIHAVEQMDDVLRHVMLAPAQRPRKKTATSRH